MRKRNRDELSEDSGYAADSEPSENLKLFKNNFRARLENAARQRISRRDISKKFRRLDSLARLLECNSICAAAYYHAPTATLWLANNKVHDNSDKENKWIERMRIVFNLVSDEELSIEEIFPRLSELIYLNFSQQHWRKVSPYKKFLEKIISKWIEEIFLFEGQTQDWREEKLEELDCEEEWHEVMGEASDFSEEKVKELESLLNKAVKLTSRLVRDFLKLRDFLLYTNTTNATAKGILTAIRKNRFHIIHAEKDKIHAEMRILSKILELNGNPNAYFGISKLCCDHCSLAVKSFSIKTRGLHGQRANWSVAAFFKQNTGHFRKFVGREASEVYQMLTPEEQKKAIEFIESRESNSINENAQHGREMYADSSDSDVAFGVVFSDEEMEDEIRDFSLPTVWLTRHVKMCYEDEIKSLTELGLSLSNVIDLYENSSIGKFETLGSPRVNELVCAITENNPEDASKSSILYEFSQLYDNHNKLFFDIINDNGDAVVDCGLEEILDRYDPDNDVDSEGEDTHQYDSIIAKIRRDNGPDSGSDYASDSDNYSDSNHGRYYYEDDKMTSDTESSANSQYSL